MVSVAIAKTFDDSMTPAAGEQHTLRAMIWAGPLCAAAGQERGPYVYASPAPH